MMLFTMKHSNTGMPLLPNDTLQIICCFILKLSSTRMETKMRYM
uniref:Uncharacterized protein n=1 Tax=Arundo donax TaxID=35708 RepID=A0A0A9FI16_ARUDO